MKRGMCILKGNMIPYSGFLLRGINNRVRWYVAVLKSAVFNAPLLIVT